MRFPERIILPLEEGMTAQIDAALEAGETRVEAIRGAIKRELKRRARAKGPSSQA
jgi:hypothetical protein